MILFINIIIILSSSFFMAYFMNNKTTTIINHKLCLYSSVFLSLAWLVCFPFPFIYRPWNLLFSRIYEWMQGNLGNVVQFLWEFLIFLLFCKTYQVLVSTAVLPNFQSFECLCKCCSDGAQTKNQLEYRLCKDDNKLEALEIYLWYLTWKTCLLPLIFFFL